MRRFIVDTDTASDDAVALIMALRDRQVSVEAITVVAGNVELEQAVQNALYTVELCDSSVPVFAGAAAPLTRPLQTATHVHGEDGMGDIGLSLSGRAAAEAGAVDALIETVDRYPDEIRLVTLGPLTNIALALRRVPDLASRIDACYVMGGVGRGPGNITPVAEFNIWVDPEAARIVFESGLPITMIGWDVAHRFAAFSALEIDAMRSLGTPLAEFSVDVQKTVVELAAANGQEGFVLPDPVTMAVAMDPTLVTEARRLPVTIETESELCRGQTVVDHRDIAARQPANADVVLAISRGRFVEMLRDSLSEPGVGTR